jgi:4-amino-4-deoxy-L-arabinose transferase-like glycosyltransferase
VAIFALVALAIWDRKAAWLKDLGWTWGLILFAAIVLPWAMMITVATDGAFWGAASAATWRPSWPAARRAIRRRSAITPCSRRS